MWEKQVLVTYAFMQSLLKHSLAHARVQGICIPTTVMPLGDNGNTHACAYLPSLRESCLRNQNLAHAAAILSSMGHSTGIK